MDRVKKQAAKHKAKRLTDFNTVKPDIPKLLAGIFAVWSVNESCSSYKETGEMKYVLKPHPVQVLAIFRLLEIDREGAWTDRARQLVGMGPAITNHMIQIGTGEGKSVILGGLATLLSLLGHRVFCACYSKYLSRRDYNSFLSLFTYFRVADRVTYSTLAELTGIFINEEVEVREATNRWIHGTWDHSAMVNRRESGEKILLIDEVDVFFDREFYGATYDPSTYIKDPKVNTIMQYIWDNREDSNKLRQIFSLPAFEPQARVRQVQQRARERRPENDERRRQLRPTALLRDSG